MHPLIFDLLRLIYPIEFPNRKRDRPLQVLALGISRSGTDSLRQALEELGYTKVYHGFDYGASPNGCVQFIRLGEAQHRGQKELLTAMEFDKVLGHSDAVTDIPPAGFALELLDAYPDAKVIVNYREDVDAWWTSCYNTIELAATSRQPWKFNFLSFFQPNLFWQQTSYWWVWTRYFGDFQSGAKEWYRRHYRELEEKLQKEDRSYLKWKVEDGWGPLCRFLEKEVPEHEFPHGNMQKEFFEKVARMKHDFRKEAARNVRVAGFALLVVGVVVFGYLYDQWS